jgi:hypothetical protein
MCARLAAEGAMRRLLDDAGLDPPDRVEQWEVSVAFFWDEPKLVVAIDLCDPPPGWPG